MAPHSSTLAWKIPWMEEPGRPQSMGSLRLGYGWATSLSLFSFTHWRRKWQPTPVFLPGESQGRGSLVGCPLGDRTESDTTEATQQQQQHLVGISSISITWDIVRNGGTQASPQTYWVRICILTRFLDKLIHGLYNSVLSTWGKWSEIRSVVSDSLQPRGLYSPWNSPGQNTGVGSLSLLQEIFPTRGSNPGLPHCGQILYQLNHKGSPLSTKDHTNPHPTQPPWRQNLQ